MTTSCNTSTNGLFGLQLKCNLLFSCTLIYRMSTKHSITGKATFLRMVTSVVWNASDQSQNMFVNGKAHFLMLPSLQTNVFFPMMHDSVDICVVVIPYLTTETGIQNETLYTFPQHVRQRTYITQWPHLLHLHFTHEIIIKHFNKWKFLYQFWLKCAAIRKQNFLQDLISS
jgi:hypothetical protein